jgi:hypothetical protein
VLELQKQQSMKEVEEVKAELREQKKRDKESYQTINSQKKNKAQKEEVVAKKKKITVDDIKSEVFLFS